MPREEKERTIEDIHSEMLKMPDGSQEPGYSIADARIYLGVSESAVLKILRRHNITRYKRGIGPEKYVLKKDLDKLLEAHPVEDDE
jgi:hypothetical protein